MEGPLEYVQLQIHVKGMKQTKPCHCCAGSGRELNHVAVGSEMRALREFHRLTLAGMSNRMKLSLSYLSDLERGRRNWNDDLITKFKEACK